MKFELKGDQNAKIGYYRSLFTRDYQVLRAKYDSRIRNWHIEYSNPYFIVEDSSGTLEFVYHNGKITNCTCDHFLTNESGTCMHIEAVNILPRKDVSPLMRESIINCQFLDSYRGEVLEFRKNKKDILTLPSVRLFRDIKSKFSGNYGDISNAETRRRHTNNDGSYKPYSLKDYKQIASAKIVLGGLGPNTGTKEWEEKQRKMKKMEEYANSVSKNKIILKVKKEEPSQIIEREKKEKAENSVRTKAYEYARLIRPKSKTHFNNEDYPNISENKNINNSRYGSNTSELDIIQKKRENLRFQIDEIKESLLK